ncbi:MAG: hypothetical protein QOE61_2431 [Micromonosporaceae bacterium]|nr:hypothetical protein [Micromonosporaceae bacterium]
MVAGMVLLRLSATASRLSWLSSLSPMVARSPMLAWSPAVAWSPVVAGLALIGLLSASAPPFAVDAASFARGGVANVAPAAWAPTARAPTALAAWTWPLAGAPTVTRRFAPPPSPWLSGHRGVDLAGNEGQPVLAAGGGVVAYAGLVAGRGVVSVDHAGGLRTTYEPVRAAALVNQPVAAGEVLGTLAGGHAGCPVAACLHWGLRRGETYLDPLVLMHPPRLRLKPDRQAAPRPAAALAARRPTGRSPRAGCRSDPTPSGSRGCARRRRRLRC